MVGDHFIDNIRDKVRIKAKGGWYKDLEEKGNIQHWFFDGDESGHVP